MLVDPKEVFGRDAEQYDASRIGYAGHFVASVVDSVYNHQPRPDELHIVDMGAGTGQLGEEFLKLGHRVTFVEPSSHSVEFLRHKFGNHPKATIIEGTAENTGLKDHGADMIVMGDAAHWFGPSAVAESRRILKPEGKVAAFARFWSQESPITEKLHELLLQESEEYQSSPTQLMRDVGNLRKRLGRHLIHQEDNAWYGYSLPQPYTQDGLVDYLKSCSFSKDAVERNEPEFRKNVIEPLWEHAQDNGLLNPDGTLRTIYEIHSQYGTPRKLIDQVKSSGVQQAAAAR